MQAKFRGGRSTWQSRGDCFLRKFTKALDLGGMIRERTICCIFWFYALSLSVCYCLLWDTGILRADFWPNPTRPFLRSAILASFDDNSGWHGCHTFLLKVTSLHLISFLLTDRMSVHGCGYRECLHKLIAANRPDQTQSKWPPSLSFLRFLAIISPTGHTPELYFRQGNVNSASKRSVVCILLKEYK